MSKTLARTVVIFNPGAGGAEEFEAARRRLAERGVEIRPTGAAGDARRLAQEAADQDAGLVVAAGGDGTVNSVVNGVMAARQHGRASPTIGIIPLGTGNDLPRTLDIPLDPNQALDVIESAAQQTIDLIRVRHGRRTFYGCNVAAGGFTGQMNEAMTDAMKKTWGPLAYLRGAIKVVPDLTRYHTNIRYDGRATERVQALNIIVANGRTAGGGTVVAPDANPQDGLLDVVIVRGGTALELAGVAARLLAGDYTNSDLVAHRQARRVHVRSKPGMWFNVDGELITNEPLTFSVEAHALRVIVGPNYSPAGRATT
jgi:diacylglycerol kinase (ATP)